MTKGVYRKTVSGFIPVDDVAKAEHAKCKLGQDVLGDMKRHRNVNHHRKYWQLCQIVADHSDRYPNAETVHKMFLIATGHYDEHAMKNGRVACLPHSINFATMGQSEFEGFYEEVIRLVCARIIPGLEAGNLRNQIEELCGIGAAA